MEAEMSRYHIKNADIQSLLDCTDKTVSNKISGTTEFSVREAIKIRDSFFPGHRLEYLFGSDNRQRDSA